MRTAARVFHSTFPTMGRLAAGQALGLDRALDQALAKDERRLSCARSVNYCHLEVLHIECTISYLVAKV